MAREAVIHRINPYLLRGEQYYETLYSDANEPDTVRESRIAHTNLRGNYPLTVEGQYETV